MNGKAKPYSNGAKNGNSIESGNTP